jgi:hypothetical protein
LFLKIDQYAQKNSRLGETIHSRVEECTKGGDAIVQPGQRAVNGVEQGCHNQQATSKLQIAHSQQTADGHHQQEADQSDSIRRYTGVAHKARNGYDKTPTPFTHYVCQHHLPRFSS